MMPTQSGRFSAKCDANAVGVAATCLEFYPGSTTHFLVGTSMVETLHPSAP